jgi:hypothetical protein
MWELLRVTTLWAFMACYRDSFTFKGAEISQSVQRLAAGWTTKGSEFSFPRRSNRFWDPVNPLSNGYRGLYPWGKKRKGPEADPTARTGAEVKNTWIYISIPPYAFMA